jgi:DNA-binding transcriptional LysR family regulator
MNSGYHEHLSAFVMIAKSRSLTRASAVTGAGQSTLSRQLAALENHLGCKLFHRSTRSIKLTEKGELFLPHAERILQAAADAKELRYTLGSLSPRWMLFMMPSGRGSVLPSCPHGFARTHWPMAHSEAFFSEYQLPTLAMHAVTLAKPRAGGKVQAFVQFAKRLLKDG